MRQSCQLSKLLYKIAAEVLANLVDADKRIKGIQIGDHDEIKIVNFTDNIPIFLRDITCHKIKMILRLYEKDKIVLYEKDKLVQR